MSSNHAENGGSSSNEKKDVDHQMQQVLQLLTDRTKGKATNEEVEKAVSQILSAAGLATSSSESSQAALQRETMRDTKVKATTVSEEEPKIELDTGNYDDDDEEEEEVADKGTNPMDAKKTLVEPPTTKRKRGRPMNPDKEATRNRKLQESHRKEQYDPIPLGIQGAHMLTAFGDGPNPQPLAVAAALLGARRLLQVTVQDARALRRKATEQFQKAQTDVAKYSKATKKQKSNNNNNNNNKGNKAMDSTATQQPPEHSKEQQQAAVVDPTMLYRAFTGYDKLAYAPKCGFDYEQLMGMYPEEMRAYARWNQLRDEYDEKTDDKAVATATEDPDGSQAVVVEESDLVKPEAFSKDGGHLEERAVQFDVRTSLMEEGWYMKFSEHRKGSFLPRRLKQEGDNEWEEQRKSKQVKGRQENGIWSNMTANSARFLHWVGFDPNKGLPPPNEETTHALAFLGYDFMGRIVEKAIFLKNLAKAKLTNEEVDERTILLELENGDQLEKRDIDKAMGRLKPASLYGSVDGPAEKPVAHLYFGPGFEDRLELELEELMCGSTERTDISQKEATIRREEDRLFADIAAPPSTNNAVMQLLGQNENDDEEL